MNFDCKEQLSGFSEADFYLLSETSNWPVVLSDANAHLVVFTPEVNSVVATLVPDSITSNIKGTKTDRGELFKPLVRFNFITISESLEQLLEQYKNKPGVLILKSNDGFKKIVGSNLEPIYMSYEVKNGKDIDD